MINIASVPLIVLTRSGINSTFSHPLEYSVFLRDVVSVLTLYRSVVCLPTSSIDFRGPTTCL